MSAAADNRIATIRANAREERALLSDLNDRIGDDLKKLLQPASSHLDDAEGFLLPEFLEHPSHSEREMTKWLDFVEGILDRAIEHRKWVQGFIKKFGWSGRLPVNALDGVPTSACSVRALARRLNLLGAFANVWL